MMRDGKFCMRRSLGRDSRGGKSTISQCNDEKKTRRTMDLIDC